MENSWSEYVWEKSRNLYSNILRLPFLSELMSGALDRRIFIYYLEQDEIYLNGYTSVLDKIADKMEDPSSSALFRKLSMENIVAENELHKYLEKERGMVSSGGRSRTPSPFCRNSLAYLEMIADTRPAEVAVASVLPCFLVYEKVGNHMKSLADRNGNPYIEWIDTYSSDSFSESVKALSSLADSMAEKAAAGNSGSLVDDMTAAFLKGVELEFEFWTGAYNFVPNKNVSIY